ncbi:hypothetical protein [Arthrobacter sp. RCC_34]|uniref:hypothetical protein n=1 Tax=Arthrobacter sp. RCC_34 TaxID=3239230 RepID=UPI003525EA31
MTEHITDEARQAGTIRELEARIARLERVAVGAYDVILGALLIAGLTVPIFTTRETRGDSRVDTPVSVFTVIFQRGIAPDSSSGDDPALSALFMIGFVGLLVVTVLLIVLLLVAAARALTVPLRRAGWILVTLGIIGAFVLLTFTMMAASNHESDKPGWGAVLLMLGVLGVIPLLTRAAASLMSPSAPPATDHSPDPSTAP